MPAMFFLDDEELEKMEKVRVRVEKVLGREIPEEESVFDTIIEILDYIPDVWDQGHTANAHKENPYREETKEVESGSEV